MSRGARWKHEDYIEFLKTYCSPASTPHMEPHPVRQPMAKKKDTRPSTPCRIHILSIRKRLADADGVSGKAAIDGLVQAGVLAGDGPKHVKSVVYEQSKAVDGNEYTLIQLRWGET